jgi:hypothetical protein
VIALAVVVLAVVIGFFAVRSAQAGKEFQRLSTAAGCTAVQDTNPGGNTLGRTHLGPTETVTYSTSPPSGGPHNPVPLPHGVYANLSTDPAASPNIYQAVHSLEHGYVGIWYKSSSELAQLTPFGDGSKVIVISYPQLPKGSVALTAWGRLQSCDRTDSKQIQAFVDRYRLKSAPEPGAQ